MRLLPLLVVAFVACATATPARAIPEGAPFSLSTPDGPDPTGTTPIGTISFVLDGGETRDGGCLYFAEWDGENTDAQVSVGCFLEEGKTHGHASCARNRDASFATVIRTVPGRPCMGFDVFGMPQTVLLWSALESDAGFVGLIQWTAAAPYLVPVEATPYP